MIQKTIHQIWGMCAADADKPLPTNFAANVESWKRLNPQWHYKLWDRKSIEALIATTPWSKTFYAFPHWVQQCDFARYVIVYLFGGLYTDMDTVCRAPIDRYIHSYDMVVGVEANVTESERLRFNLARRLQICQWTFAAKAKCPVLLRLIERICNDTSQSCYPDKMRILNSTGPGVFSDAVLESPKDSNILLLPITAFGCGQMHSNSPEIDDVGCYAVHQFEGSWKSTPRWLHKLSRGFLALWRSF